MYNLNVVTRYTPLSRYLEASYRFSMSAVLGNDSSPFYGVNFDLFSKFCSGGGSQRKSAEVVSNKADSCCFHVLSISNFFKKFPPPYFIDYNSFLVFL